MKKIAAPKKFSVTLETEEILKNGSLDGVKTLNALKITSKIEVKRQLNAKTNKPIKIVSTKRIDQVVEPVSFHLKEVSPDEISIYRRNKVPSFVLKVDGKLYHATIHINTTLMSSTILGTHQCAIIGHECKRLSAASDNNGGCAKVRNRSKYIEKYPWITTGYETFNTHYDCFVVVNCLHHEPCQPRKKPSSADANRAKLGLAQFVWADVTTQSEVRRRVIANHQKNSTIK